MYLSVCVSLPILPGFVVLPPGSKLRHTPGVICVIRHPQYKYPRIPPENPHFISYSLNAVTVIETGRKVGHVVSVVRVCGCVVMWCGEVKVGWESPRENL